MMLRTSQDNVTYVASPEQHWVTQLVACNFIQKGGHILQFSLEKKLGIVEQGNGFVYRLSALSKPSLGGDKVSMLTHTYPHKPLRKIEVTICNHQADSLLYVWLNV